MKKLSKKFISWINIKGFVVLNITILIVIKTALPLLDYHMATSLEQISLYDSREIVIETNKIRGAHNLHVLTPNTKLDLAASEKLNDMVKNNYFSHISPQGTTPWVWIEKNGYNYSHAGENLALGFLNAKTTLSGWMNSPSHRANIINTNYDEIGVATGKATINGITGILTVQMFGKSTTKQIAIPQPTPASTPEPTINPPPASATPIVSLSPTENNNVAGTETQNDEQPPKKDPVQLQYVSTDSNIVAVSNPTETTNNFEPFPKLTYFYQIYMFLTIMTLIIIMMFIGARKRLVLTAAISLSLLLISEFIPAAIVTTKSMVF